MMRKVGSVPVGTCSQHLGTFVANHCMAEMAPSPERGPGLYYVEEPSIGVAHDGINNRAM